MIGTLNVPVDILAVSLAVLLRYRVCMRLLITRSLRSSVLTLSKPGTYAVVSFIIFTMEHGSLCLTKIADREL